MTHFGILCPPAAGHLNPLTSLGGELKARGHQVTLFGILDAKAKAEFAGLEFSVLGEFDCPYGTVARFTKHLGELYGLAALLYTIKQYKNAATIVLRDAPQAIMKAGVEVLLVDQTTLEGGTVADFLNIPFITLSAAVILNPDPGVPPALTSWGFDPSWWAIFRNQIGYSLLSFVTLSHRELIQSQRREWNLPAYNEFNDACSPLAQISQQPAEFEFPRKALPKNLHFTGPFLSLVRREPIEFPFDRLSGQPLIYASLGTVQNQVMRVYRDIAEACAGLDAHLVISLGNSNSPEILRDLPGDPLVVKCAPQLELLEKATLTITHGGMNTVLESLSYGVPIVAIPITNDQPGVAARIAWTGTGEVVELQHLSPSKLRAAIKQVLTDASYKNNAIRLQTAIHQSSGMRRAADIIEQAVSTGKPVLRSGV